MTRRQALLLFGAALPEAAANTLADEWNRIAAETDEFAGVAALHLGTGAHAGLHGSDHFPMASVCKLPIALHILAMVDEGKFNRTQMIEVLPAEVTRNVSEVGERWPKQKRFPLDELLQLMVAKSDNTAVETLYRIGGGAGAITARLRGWQVDGIRIDRPEHQCNLDFARDARQFLADPRDTATPEATVQLLRRLWRGELFSAGSTARMIEILESTTTGPGRIRGMLPAGTVVAHKTGTSGSSHGVNGGTNDVGVINSKLVVAVYLKGGKRDLAARERIIARLARAAFDRLT